MSTGIVSVNGNGRKGFTITAKGYRRITCGPDRHQYAHRVKARECMKASGRELTPDMEVHHLCGTRDCDRDFHLLILPGCFHDMFKRYKRRYYPEASRYE